MQTMAAPTHTHSSLWHLQGSQVPTEECWGPTAAPGEHQCQGAYLQFRGLEGMVCALPQCPEQHGKADGQASTRPQRVVIVDF